MVFVRYQLRLLTGKPGKEDISMCAKAGEGYQSQCAKLMSPVLSKMKKHHSPHRRPQPPGPGVGDRGGSP